MQHALLTLRDFISLSRSQSNTPLSPAHSLVTVAEELYTEMVMALSIAQTDENRTASVHICQRALYRLLQLPQPQKDPAQCQYIESLILEIKEQLPAYFNWDDQIVSASVPVSRIVKKLHQVIKKYPPLTDLLSILLQHLKMPNCTWRALDCIDFFLSNASLSETDPFTIAIQYNFNIPRVNDYAISLYQQSAGIGNDDNFKVQLRQLTSISIRSPHGMIGNYPSLKDQLACRLNDEIYNTANLTAAITPSSKKESFKVATTLSVAQFAALVRLLTETGILTCTNTTQFLSIIAANITTPSSGNISPLSFRNKFYNIERNTAMSLKDICISLLNATRKLSG